MCSHTWRVGHIQRFSRVLKGRNPPARLLQSSLPLFLGSLLYQPILLPALLKSEQNINFSPSVVLLGTWPASDQSYLCFFEEWPELDQAVDTSLAGQFEPTAQIAHSHQLPFLCFLLSVFVILYFVILSFGHCSNYLVNCSFSSTANLVRFSQVGSPNWHACTYRHQNLTLLTHFLKLRKVFCQKLEQVHRLVLRLLTFTRALFQGECLSGAITSLLLPRLE